MEQRRRKPNRLKDYDYSQNAPCAYAAFSLFYNGKFITHEIPNEKKFAAICEEFAK